MTEKLTLRLNSYSLPLSEEFTSAIEWHGNRYLASELLCKAIIADDDGANPRIELTESDAWELRDAWESEDCCLSCGSRALNSALDEFIGSFV